MSGLKTMSELDVLRLASAELNRRLAKWLDKREQDPADAEVYDEIIEQYDRQIEELQDAIDALERVEVTA